MFGARMIKYSGKPSVALSNLDSPLARGRERERERAGQDCSSPLHLPAVGGGCDLSDCGTADKTCEVRNTWVYGSSRRGVPPEAAESPKRHPRFLHHMYR